MVPCRNWSLRQVRTKDGLATSHDETGRGVWDRTGVWPAYRGAGAKVEPPPAAVAGGNCPFRVQPPAHISQGACWKRALRNPSSLATQRRLRHAMGIAALPHLASALLGGISRVFGGNETAELPASPRRFASHFISWSNFRTSPSNAPICLRSAIAFPVNSPCRNAFRFPLGAPDPGAPPCMRQRRLPRNAGARHDAPVRVLAPQRRLAIIGWTSGA